MRILLSSNPYRDKGLKTALEAREILLKSGVDVALTLPFQMKKGDKLSMPPNVLLSTLSAELPVADVLVCFGGDGTILHAARDAVKYQLPILGVNMGSVGFMAELERTELSALARLGKKDYTIEKRMMLEIRHFRGNKLLTSELALNDAVISKGSMARVAEVEIYADNTHVTTIMGDGAIFSTPTGSTAYSLSAGGSIVEPSAQCLLMSPICPHHLAARSIVLAPERTLRVQLPSNSQKYLFLATDGGNPQRISSGDYVEITKSVKETKLIRLTNRSFYQILNHKLGGASQ
ncbi:MAG: NAD(+)/NADH kinase [Eubacteriales bacterium]